MKAAMALCAASVLTLLAAARSRAEDDLVYVKKETREATRQAALEASGAIRWPATWQIIGPFDNTDGAGLDTVYPPERGIDLAATYEGKGEKARWRGVNLRDGLRVSLARFKKSEDCVCYLYRKIETPRPIEARVSIGSENQVVAWLNGKPLVFTGAGTRRALEQDTATLDLREGANDLLIKVAHRKDKWNFYFNPLVSARFQVKLDRLLDRDFPPAGEAEHYRIEALPLPPDTLVEVGGLAFRPDGKLYVATRRGDVWLVTNPTAEDVDQIHWQHFAAGLHEPLGLLAEGNHALYVVQRPEMSLLRDTDGDEVADDYETVCDRFGISGNYHEFAYGPVRDAAGDYFLTLNLGFSPPLSEVAYRGCCVKVGRDGALPPGPSACAARTASISIRRAGCTSPTIKGSTSLCASCRRCVAASSTGTRPACRGCRTRAKANRPRSCSRRSGFLFRSRALGGRTGVGHDHRRFWAVCRPVFCRRGDQLAHHALRLGRS